jgi:hypothetical protein
MANVLNLPYIDLDIEPKKDDEIPAIKSPKHSMEPAQDFEVFTSKDEGETSRNKKSKKSQKIKEMKEIMAQEEILERVIKARNKTLSENFDKLALKSIKDKKKKKKISKEYSSLWW